MSYANYQLLFADNAQQVTLATPLTSAGLVLTVSSSALFPTITPGSTPPQAFVATLQKNSMPTTLEIVLVTATSGITYTIVRAQEGTTALTWNAGDFISNYCTAGSAGAFIQAFASQAQGGNYAIDTGSANHYAVVLTPPLTQHVVGMPVRWKAANTNTGNSVFNDGFGSAALLLLPGVQVPAGTIVAGGMYTSVWNGSAFQLQFSANLANYATLAQVFPGSSLLTNGWRKNSDGSIEQWGQYSAAGGANNIILPLAFPAAVLNVQYTPVNVNQEVIWTPNGATTYISGNFGGGVVSYRVIGK